MMVIVMVMLKMNVTMVNLTTGWMILMMFEDNDGDSGYDDDGKPDNWLDDIDDVEDDDGDSGDDDDDG